MESASISTPAFLLWAIEYSCSIRGFQNGSDPDRTERQLRAAMALSAARREGRVLEGYCVDPPLGFRIEEALVIYGGLEEVERTCGNCPANALALNWPGALAGCLGMFVLPAEEGEFYRQVDEAIERLGCREQYSRLFSPTRPCWRGLWISQSLTAEQAGFVAELLGQFCRDALADGGLNDLQAGLRAAQEHGLSFHAALYPLGSVQNRAWRLVPHCPLCKADWNSPGRGRCSACQYAGHPAPNQKRGVRGRRPYIPLERLMGPEAAKEFMARFGAIRCRGG